MPASSTGKYHPQFAQGQGGLIRHIKVVCMNVEIMMKTMPQYDEVEDWSVPYISAILHDCMKYTEYNQKYTHDDHPLKIAELVRMYKMPNNKELTFNHTNEWINEKLERIAKNVETHMGRWNSIKSSENGMPVPSTMENFIVHIADFMSAQKDFTASFDKDNNVINSLKVKF
jgi:HD superfamily phosphodiesterase